MTKVVEIDEREIQITPLFKMIEIENIPKSEAEGHAVMEIKEVVEVRFAGSRNYSPIFPTDDFSHRVGNQVITYAERWPDQYRAFKEGNAQEAAGTPLEMLRPFGVTPEQLSLCRALRIYSIEALHFLEGPGRKALGMNGNKLKEAAASFMAERAKNKGQFDELETLRARIAELEARSTQTPVEDSTPEQIKAAVAAADAAYADLSNDQLKEEIAKLNDGKKPVGNPSRDSLVSMLETLMAA